MSLAVVGNGVEIKTSQIPYSGNGLFATRDFKKNELVTEYYGRLVDSKTAEQLRLRGAHLYVRSVAAQHTAINGECLPDQARGRGGASFANDARDSAFANNVKFVVTDKAVKGRDMKMEPSDLRSLDHVYLKATSDIAKGEEIFVSYGEGYWSHLKKMRMTREDYIKVVAVPLSGVTL